MKENIEEDIKIVEKLIKTMEQDRITFKDEQTKEIYAYFITALEHILSDYKRLQEEFKQVDHECERLEQKELRLEKEIEIAKEALKKQCDIADERNQLLRENQKLQKENEELKSDNLEYQRTQDIFDEREYRKKYLEERRAEEPNLLYPDADEIYERYYKLKAENEELKEYIMLAPNLDEMTAVEYINIQKEAYIKGRTEEQQKAEQIICEQYISKQKIKDKIEELKEKPLKINENNKYYYETDAYNKIIIQVLQDLLEEKGE